MAYDLARGVAVLFGGWDGRSLEDTWEWDGTTWIPGRDAAPEVVVFVVPTAGVARLGSSLPNVPALTGVEFHNQAYALDPARMHSE